MEREFFVLRRVSEMVAHEVEFMVVLDTCGDPLHGRGTWDICAGPFASREEAEDLTILLSERS